MGDSGTSTGCALIGDGSVEAALDCDRVTRTLCPLLGIRPVSLRGEGSLDAILDRVSRFGGPLLIATSFGFCLASSSLTDSGFTLLQVRV